MDKKQLFALSDDAVNQAGGSIISLAKDIWKNPETGYRENRTSALLVKTLQDLGFEVKTGLAVTGFRADLDTGKPGPVVAIMGELDALLIPSHPEAVNGAAHSCGHNTSAAALIGTAIGLKAAVQSGELCGKIAFIGTPAEEGIELEYRQSLIKEGKIGSIAGKSQLLRERVLDDVDIAFMHHLSNRYGFNDHNGSVCKKIVFSGDYRYLNHLGKLLDDCDVLLIETGHHKPWLTAETIRKTPAWNVRRLIFVHHGRDYLNNPAETAEKTKQAWGKTPEFANDGMFIGL